MSLKMVPLLRLWMRNMHMYSRQHLSLKCFWESTMIPMKWVLEILYGYFIQSEHPQAETETTLHTSSGRQDIWMGSSSKVLYYLARSVYEAALSLFMSDRQERLQLYRSHFLHLHYKMPKAVLCSQLDSPTLPLNVYSNMLMSLHICFALMSREVRA